MQPVGDASMYAMLATIPSFAMGVMAPLVYFFYSKTLFAKGTNKKLRLPVLLFSLGLSFCFILGESFRLYDDLRLIISAGSIHLSFFIFMIGYIPLFYAIAELAICYADKYIAGSERLPIRNQKQNPLAGFGLMFRSALDKHPILVPMMVCIVAWSPYIIMHFPGSATWDASWQIEEFMGARPWSQHHPLVSSIFFGVLFQIGTSIYGENTNLGLFLITMFQTLMLSGCFAFVLYKMKAWGIPFLFRIITLLFFAFNPWIAIQSQSIVKDVTAIPFITMFSLYLLELVREINLGETVKKSTWIPLVTFAILAALWRHPNLYIALLSLLPILLLKQAAKQRLLLLACTIGIVLCHFAVTTSLAAFLDARPGQASEAMSIPFQQTARFIRDFPDEVTAEERQAIDQVLVFDRLAEVYNSRLSDPVKNQHRYNDADLPEYLRHWFAMGLRRPQVYIEATLSNSFSYFAPVRHFFEPRNTNVHFHNSQVFDNIAGVTNVQNPEQRLQIRHLIFDFTRLPIINLFFQIANYTWALLLCILILYVKNRKGFILGFLPALWTIAVCIASPVNGYLRYFLPVYVLFPVLLAYMVVALGSGQTRC